MGESGTSDTVGSYLESLPERYSLTGETRDLGEYARLYALESGNVSGDNAKVVEVLMTGLEVGHVMVIKDLWEEEAAKGGPKYFVVPGGNGEPDTIMRLHQEGISDIKPDSRIDGMIKQGPKWMMEKVVKRYK